MKKLVGKFRVIENIPLNTTNFHIRLKSPEPLPEIEPGQFVNIEVPGMPEIFLRRPFSIFDVDYENSEISLLIKILGRGSKKLTSIKAGDILDIVFPLGKSFTYPEKTDKILLIGGGSGVAPVLFLAKKCGLPKENVTILIGARSAEDHVSVEDYQEFGYTFFTTEDGTLGTKGLVTSHPVFADQLDSFDKIYTCGPDPMMKAIGKIAKSKNIWCEVSLENLMACGFGVCLCCIEPTTEGNLCVCTDGPVFNIKKLKW